MLQELWGNRTVISNHFSNKVTSISRSLGLGAHLGWLILALLGLLIVYTLIRYYEWSQRLGSQMQPRTPRESDIEAFTPEDWPNKILSESAGHGQQIVNYIQPGDHQCANLQAYISADYLIYMNQPNIQARGFDTLSEITDKYRQGICQMISNDEQLATTKWIVTEILGLKNPTWRKVAEKWLSASYLFKAQPWLEGGMPHTHGRAILMRPDWFRTSDNPTGDTAKIGILWHEMTHIWQRFQQEDFTELFTKWGFLDISTRPTPKGLEHILRKSRLNPDALPNNIWIWFPPAITPITELAPDQPGYWIGAVYPTISPQSLHDIEFRAYPLTAGGNVYLGQQSLSLDDFKPFSDFFGSGRNHYHPNELAAHFMDELLTGRLDNKYQGCRIFEEWLNNHK